MTTTTIPGAAINAALAELQTQLPMISKDHTAKVKSERTGAQYTYSYANLAQISEAVLPLMGKLGLSFTARPTLRDSKFVLVYELRHQSGDMIAGEYPLPDRGTPQEVGGAITYARRYCLCAVTGVAPDDDDNDAVAAERAARRREAREENRSRQGGAPAKESPITGDQQRRMQTLFQTLGVTEKAGKLKYATDVVRRPLGSATELTQAEAEKVIQRLGRDAERRTPAAASSGETPGQAEEWPATAKPPAGEPS